ncbi:MAG TPA: class I SAM-dependent methyltransferase [Polyangiaceae bacterium]|nr:class I SAM-dependent methyltransferase [Polyangiaceae bacterium]
MNLPELGPSDAAVFEAFVAPRLGALYQELLLAMLLPQRPSRVAHLGCRTGYPDQLLAAQLPGGELFGVDPSLSAVELAQTKASLLPDFGAHYLAAAGLPSPLEGASFTHVVCLNPVAPTAAERTALFAEACRLLVPEGQALVGMPLRGSFQEVFDLLREYAVKYDEAAVGEASEAAIGMRPTVESVTDECEAAGFVEVDVEIVRTELEFQSGRDFFEDPITRLVILPDVLAYLGLEGPVEAPLAYVREAIDRYWSEATFGLTVQVGCVSGLRAAPG